MPIVDGMTATKMIRSFEKTHGREKFSAGAQRNARVPIFAVSAALDEKRRQHYMDAGFDGWILKPVDFNRFTKLFHGIINPAVRNECVYRPGEWERGGWFESQPRGLRQTVTSPTSDSTPSSVHGFKSYPPHGEDPSDDRISREQQRLNSLKQDAVSDPSRPSAE
jgi:CheY-like chemotaxis protein